MQKTIKFEPKTGYLRLDSSQIGKLFKDLFLIFNPSMPICGDFFETFTNDDNWRVEYFVNSLNQGFEIDIMTDDYDFRDPYSFYFGCKLINIDGYELSVRPFCEYGGWSNRGKFISRSNIIFESLGSEDDFNEKFEQILSVIKINNLKLLEK